MYSLGMYKDIIIKMLIIAHVDVHVLMLNVTQLHHQLLDYIHMYNAIRNNFIQVHDKICIYIIMYQSSILTV